MKIDFDVLLRICAALEAPISLFCGGEVPAGEKKPEGAELDHIRRYRALDEHGRELVDTVTDMEYARVSAGAAPAA